MSSSNQNEGAVATEVKFTDSQICLTLKDQREIRVPLSFYPRLLKATDAQRSNFRLLGGGTGIHWPDLDEDLSVESIVLGRKSTG